MDSLHPYMGSGGFWRCRHYYSLFTLGFLVMYKMYSHIPAYTTNGLNTFFPITIIPTRKLKLPEYDKSQVWPEKEIEKAMLILHYQDTVPVIINTAKGRRNIIVGSQLYLQAAKRLGDKLVAALCVELPNIEDEKKLVEELKKQPEHQNGCDYLAMAERGCSLLREIGFDEIDVQLMINSLWGLKD